jgi:hypothetical protein
MNLSITIGVADGPLAVTAIGGARAFASIDLNDASDIRLYDPADCDQLITAVATAKAMLEMAGRPHGYEAAGDGTHCRRCGQRQDSDVHEPGDDAEDAR